MRDLECETHGVARGNVCGPECKIHPRQKHLKISIGSHKRLFLVPILLGVLTLGVITGAALNTGNSGTLFKPNNYNLTVQNSAIVVNQVFIQWDPAINAITLNMNNTSSATVTDQISITLVNGTTILGTQVFNQAFTPNQLNLQNSYGITPKLNTLVPGSTIKIGV